MNTLRALIVMGVLFFGVTLHGAPVIIAGGSVTYQIYNGRIIEKSRLTPGFFKGETISVDGIPLWYVFVECPSQYPGFPYVYLLKTDDVRFVVEQGKETN